MNNNTFDVIKQFQLENSISNILENCNIHHINNNGDISLTIVSTVNNRSNQTYFSLKTWNYVAKICGIKFQYILVEDSKNDILSIPILNSDIYNNLEITYIYINNKTWINPCINYNIGFKFIKSDKVVITNPEVCIFGNIYPIIQDNLKNDNYLVFDVFEMGNGHCLENTNDDLVKNCGNNLEYKTIEKYISDKKTHVLQGRKLNRNLHFLTCITHSNLKKMEGFDEDYAMGIAYDDDSFLNKIQFLNINIVNIFHDIHKILGIHQWHSKNEELYKLHTGIYQHNTDIYNYKKQIIDKHNIYVQFRNMSNTFCFKH
jgi:hypothetical protein